MKSCNQEKPNQSIFDNFAPIIPSKTLGTRLLARTFLRMAPVVNQHTLCRMIGFLNFPSVVDWLFLLKGF